MSWVKECWQRQTASKSDAEPHEKSKPRAFLRGRGPQFDVSSDPGFIEMIPKQPLVDMAWAGSL